MRARRAKPSSGFGPYLTEIDQCVNSERENVARFYADGYRQPAIFAIWIQQKRFNELVGYG
jgi:hypothetical protein